MFVKGKFSRSRFNAIELAMIVAGFAALAYIGGLYREDKRLQPVLSTGAWELQKIAQPYGPSRNSRYGEEWILRDFFKDERDGVFVDVGANHYQRDSNTYYLETGLGWSGIAIEPQTKFASDYKSNRPRTKFIPLFVSDTSNSEAVLYVPSNDLVASATKAYAEEESRGAAEPTRVTTTTLDDVLDRSRLTHIDFLSIDVELHEAQVLKGFSINRFQPRLVCIEARPEVRQPILEYFAAHGYIVVGKYLRADTENLWFQPQHL
jgi:FkbM family methyltransferase